MKFNDKVFLNRLSLLVICWLLAFNGFNLNAQSSASIYKQIKKLNFLGTVLYLAAHPDDENTRVISYFSNHIQARTAYLSITRGDGGQNLIGSELREGLGLIRTQELLAARKVDGGEQYFTMANDFGYSKNPEETFNIWDKEKVLEQTLARINELKPDIIINRFNMESAGRTHGHHTASAIISNMAFKECYENPSSENWKPERLFFNTSWYFYRNRDNFAKIDKSGLVAIDMGVYDPLTGKSNSEIAALSRSQHKSQGFGSSAALGSQIEYLKLVQGKPISGNDPFEGINTRWTRVKGGAPIEKIINQVIDEFDLKAPHKSVSKLLEAKELIDSIEDQHWRMIKLNEIRDIILNCLGVVVQANAPIPYGVKDESLTLNFVANNPSKTKVVLDKITLKEQTYQVNQEMKTNVVLNKKINTTIKEPISSPYWLTQLGQKGMYDTYRERIVGLANTPPPYKLEISFLIEGKKLTIERPVNYRKNDPVKGEVVTPFHVLPSATASLNTPVQLFSTSQTKKVVVQVKNLGKSFEGKLRLKLPDSWSITPIHQVVSIYGKGNEQDFIFNVTAPQTGEVALLKPELTNDNEVIEASIQEISYDHIPKQYLIQPAFTRAVALDLKTEVKKVAYINGAGDNVAESISAVGVVVEKYDANSITLEKLGFYDAVIVGIRAFNVDQTLSYKNKVLWDYVKQGGNLLIQYNTSRGLKTRNVSPLNLSISRDRVTDENAKVKFLDNKHPLLNYPNRINLNDFEGWVQERGLYFPNEWNEHYTPLLEMNDPGEEPKQGALLVANYGKGRVVYSGLSFFRQLPAGVPGAYRLFFNLIAKK
ncbi:MAG: LmbE family protein [Flavobacteriales bacterium MED-G15]|nr:MAG: LmbE family protein [Flavobacteriales bacterium MED-G15]|tara:strand:- start:3531 stop:6002 length:2472 start_codon:yes stop_codon:yes gene_type:complete